MALIMTTMELVWLPSSSGTHWPAARGQDGTSCRFLGGGVAGGAADGVAPLSGGGGGGAPAPFVEGFRALYRSSEADVAYHAACADAVRRCELSEGAFCRRTGVSAEALAELLGRSPPAAAAAGGATAGAAAAEGAADGGEHARAEASARGLVASFPGGRQAAVTLRCRGQRADTEGAASAREAAAAAAEVEAALPVGQQGAPLRLVGVRVVRLWPGVGLLRGRVVGVSRAPGGGGGGSGSGGGGGGGGGAAYVFEVRFEHGRTLGMTREEVEEVVVP